MRTRPFLSQQDADAKYELNLLKTGVLVVSVTSPSPRTHEHESESRRRGGGATSG